jgi:hypothetical protein
MRILNTICWMTTLLWACGSNSSVEFDASIDAMPQPDANLGPIPNISGNFETFLLIPNIEPPPTQMQGAHDLLEEFFDAPEVAMLRWLAMSTSGMDYITTSPWSDLFACAAPGCIMPAPTAMGLVAANAINVEASDYMQTQNIASNLSEAVSAHEERINLRDTYHVDYVDIQLPPTEGGVLPGPNAMRFHAQGFRWVNVGTGVARLEEEAVPTIDNVSLTLGSTAGDSPQWGLSMQPTLALSGYAQRMATLMNSFIVPRVTGGQGLKDMFSILDCANVSDHLNCTGAWSGDGNCDSSASSASAGISSACVEMQAAPLGRFADLLTLMIGTDATLRLQSEPGDACAIGGDATNGFLIGTVGSPCNITIDLMQEGAPIHQLQGGWYATEQLP